MHQTKVSVRYRRTFRYIYDNTNVQKIYYCPLLWSCSCERVKQKTCQHGTKYVSDTFFLVVLVTDTHCVGVNWNRPLSVIRRGFIFTGNWGSSRWNLKCQKYRHTLHIFTGKRWRDFCSHHWSWNVFYMNDSTKSIDKLPTLARMSEIYGMASISGVSKTTLSLSQFRSWSVEYFVILFIGQTTCLPRWKVWKTKLTFALKNYSLLSG